MLCFVCIQNTYNIRTARADGTRQTMAATKSATSLLPWHIVRYNIDIADYERAMVCAAMLGCDVKWTVDAAIRAGEDGNVTALSYMMERVDAGNLSRADVGKLRKLCSMAALDGRLDVMKVVGSRVPRAIDAEEVLKNPRVGNVMCLDYAMEVAGYSPYTWTVCAEAVRRDLVDVLDWARNKGLMDRMRSKNGDSCLAYIAAELGSINSMQWLCANGFAIGETSNIAYYYNQTECFLWMAQNGCYYNTVYLDELQSRKCM